MKTGGNADGAEELLADNQLVEVLKAIAGGGEEAGRAARATKAPRSTPAKIREFSGGGGSRKVGGRGARAGGGRRVSGGTTAGSHNRSGDLSARAVQTIDEAIERRILRAGEARFPDDMDVGDFEEALARRERDLREAKESLLPKASESLRRRLEDPSHPVNAGRGRWSLSDGKAVDSVV